METSFKNNMLILIEKDFEYGDMGDSETNASIRSW